MRMLHSEIQKNENLNKIGCIWRVTDKMGANVPGDPCQGSLRCYSLPSGCPSASKTWTAAEDVLFRC